MSTADETAQGLREVADWLDAHPKYEVYAGSAVYLSGVQTKDELIQLARDLGNADKDAYDNNFTLRRMFGPVEVWASIPREQVCRRIVVGTETIPARPEEEVDKVEWVCEEPLLASAPHPLEVAG